MPFLTRISLVFNILKMKFLTRYFPTIILLIIIAGLSFRKFLWCNVLLPVKNEPYGLGDIVGALPLLFLIVVCLVAILTLIYILIKSKEHSLKKGFLIVGLGTLSIPVYLLIYSYIEPICNG